LLQQNVLFSTFFQFYASSKGFDGEARGTPRVATG
jgi:hypothetical protein